MAITIDGVRIISGAEIDAAVARIDAVAAMERAFVAYSTSTVSVPPVAEILFDAPGEAHIKAGHIAGDALFAVKVATGFYGNAARGIPSSSGMITMFDAHTGRPVAILLDGGRLTDLRTAAAGAVAAKYLAPAEIGCIGIIGSGIQARLQARLLKAVTPCRTIALWARRPDAAAACAADLAAMGFAVSVLASAADVAARSQLIVTTTASQSPHLSASDIRPGTHITAVGADSEGKQELHADLFAIASVIATDSVAQARQRGDISHAMKAGTVTVERIIELGHLIASAGGRTSPEQITIADLTGVATQDIEIAKAVLAELEV